MSSIFVERLPTFCLEKYTSCKKYDVEIFRLLWGHSEWFLKQNATTFSSKKLMQSSFFVVDCAGRKSFGTCREIS